MASSLRHPSLTKLQHIPSISVSKSNLDHCLVCPVAKQKNLFFVTHDNLSSSPLDLVHLDTWDPFFVEYVDVYKYFLTIVDDCTRVNWFYMMRNKNDVHSTFLLLLNMFLNTST